MSAVEAGTVKCGRCKTSLWGASRATEATRNEKVTAHCVLTAGGLYSSLVLKIVCSPDAAPSHEQATRHNNHLGKTNINAEDQLIVFFFRKKEEF